MSAPLLIHDRVGSGAPVVLLHGWPGDRTDYRRLVPLLAADADVLVPDLRGFGESDKPVGDPAKLYSGDGQAGGVIDLIDHLEIAQAVLVGYDVGSRVAQTIAREHPDRVRAMVLAPPMPGVGERILAPATQAEFWYQAFHRLELAVGLIDGDPRTVREYLKHFWSHWSGPDFELEDEALDHLVAVYSQPGAFTASIGWYRAGAGTVSKALSEKAPDRDRRIAAPTTVLWPEHDPLFPFAWSDRLDEFFVDTNVRVLEGVGHFVPLEAPEAIASAVRAYLD